MNFSKIVSDLEDASAFDLYRLRCAIERILDDPQKILQVKQSLRIGAKVFWFDDIENREIEAEVVEIKKKNHRRPIGLIFS